MIEHALRKEQFFESMTKLKESLPIEVRDETLKAALSRIERSNKIAWNKDGSIVWAFMESEGAKRSLGESTEL
jgi:hypothetical protein